MGGVSVEGQSHGAALSVCRGRRTKPIWAEIVKNKRVFLSRACAKQFLGFADDQLQRMSGKKGRGKKGQRPESEEKYGYDVKAAMHTLRLLYECKELMSQGEISLPRPERAFLVRVRTGKYSMDKVLAMAHELFSECEEAAKSSSLPEKVERTAVSSLLSNSYLKAWGAG